MLQATPYSYSRTSILEIHPHSIGDVVAIIMWPLFPAAEVTRDIQDAVSAIYKIVMRKDSTAFFSWPRK